MYCVKGESEKALHGSESGFRRAPTAGSTCPPDSLRHNLDAEEVEAARFAVRDDAPFRQRVREVVGAFYERLEPSRVARARDTRRRNAIRS